MARVRIRPTRGNGREISKSEKVAAKLVELGAYEYVRDEPAPAPAAPPASEPDDLESLTVAELRERAGDMEIEGTGASGNVVKADLVRALSGTYFRRDMRAE
jgi:uncharacterized small protein (DUF1192 family)